MAIKMRSWFSQKTHSKTLLFNRSLEADHKYLGCCLPIKSIKTQTRRSLSIDSTVVIKFAKGPVMISTTSPSFNISESIVFSFVLNRSIILEINLSGTGLGLPLILTSLDTPIVLLFSPRGNFWVYQQTCNQEKGF